MNSLLFAMLLVFVTWCILFAAFGGIGLIFRRLMRQRLHAPDDMLLDFWMGLALTCGVLQAWHLVFPVDGRIAGILLAVGFTGLIWNWPELWRVMMRGEINLVPVSAPLPAKRGGAGVARILLFILWLLFIAWLANRSINGPWDSDSAYYHLPGILWAKSYPIVPGLANLHPMLGLNNVTFLYAALLDNGFWQNHLYHLVNSLLMFVLFNQCFLYLVRLARAPEILRLEYASAVLLIGVLVMQVISVAISSPGTDYPTGFFAVVVFFQAVIFVSLRPENLPAGTWQAMSAAHEPIAQNHHRLAAVLILSVTGLTFKLSFLWYFAGIALVVTGIWLYRTGWRDVRSQSRLLLWAGLYCTAYLMLWMFRGVILSGYPLYPATLLSVPVDWRVPEATARLMDCHIRAYGFYNGAACRPFGGWDWIPGWLEYNLRDLFFFTLPAGLMIFTISVACMAGIYRRVKRPAPSDTSMHQEIYVSENKNVLKFFLRVFVSLRLCVKFLIIRGEWALLFPFLLALLFWFIYAPQVRFAALLIWLLVIYTALLTILSLTWLKPVYQTGLILALAVVIATYPIYLAIRARIVITEPGDYYGLYSIPADKTYHQFITDSGLTLYYPDSGQGCWNAKLLCTPSTRADIRLRVPGDIGQGFARDAEPEQP